MGRPSSPRTKPCPLFVDAPDENLVEWFGHRAADPGPRAGTGLRQRPQRRVPRGARLRGRRRRLLGRGAGLGAGAGVSTTSPRTAARSTSSWCAGRCGRRARPACFRPEGGGALTDREVYERRTLGGGLGYSDEQLRTLWGDGFAVDVLRPMRASTGEAFGEEFLSVLLANGSAQRPATHDHRERDARVGATALTSHSPLMITEWATQGPSLLPWRHCFDDHHRISPG